MENTRYIKKEMFDFIIENFAPNIEGDYSELEPLRKVEFKDGEPFFNSSQLIEDFILSQLESSSYDLEEVCLGDAAPPILSDDYLELEDEKHLYDIIPKGGFGKAKRGGRDSKTISDLARLKSNEDTFQEYLFKLIDQKKMKDSEVYTNATLTPQHFSKIRSNRYYVPKKETVMCLILALKCTVKQATTLLNKAGFTFSDSITYDLCILYCIKNKIYNIDEINEYMYSLIHRTVKEERKMKK